MSSIPETASSVSPCVLAALLFAATSHLRALDLPRPTTRAVLEATGATRSRAYEVRNRLLGLLPTLERRPGRPSRPPPEQPTTVSAELSREALRYLMDHPGAVSHKRHKRYYSDGFRHFAVGLCERHQDLDVEQVATAIEVPATTLREWLRAGPASVREPAPADTANPNLDPDPQVVLDPVRDLHVQTVLEAWATWRGPFTAFCEHVQHHHHVPLGRAAISSILHRAGERVPKRRRGRSPDELALRRSFETFFPGAQWTGDGTPVTVSFEGQCFAFNLELCVDTASAAALGLDVRDHEDSAAVVAAFDDAIATTGTPPLALLLDNKPSNHTPEVDAALGHDTVRLRATLGRAQNKAHVEGAFGLFAQTAPPIVIDGSTSRDRARQVLELQARTWARTLNQRPRADLHGLSRFDLYQEANPSDTDVARARAALQARAREQHRAHETRRARQDPVVRLTLDNAFERLGLQDPQSNLRNAIARYPLDRIVEALSIFEGKRLAGSLPENVDARYLLGIVRNLAHEAEGMAVAEHLWKLRLHARDRVFDALRVDQLILEHRHPDPDQRLTSFVDRSLATNRAIDRFFWLTCAADLVRDQPPDVHRSLFRLAARRIHTTHRVPHRDRLRATRFFAAKLLPLD